MFYITQQAVPVAAVRRFFKHELGDAGDEFVEVDQPGMVCVDFIEYNTQFLHNGASTPTCTYGGKSVKRQWSTPYTWTRD